MLVFIILGNKFLGFGQKIFDEWFVIRKRNKNIYSNKI